MLAVVTDPAPESKGEVRFNEEKGNDDAAQPTSAIETNGDESGRLVTGSERNFLRRRLGEGETKLELDGISILGRGGRESST